MNTRVTQGQAVKPGPRARTEDQATRRAGHCPRGAAQDAQQLQLDTLKSGSALGAALWPVDVVKTGCCRVMRDGNHAEIVKFGGDMDVSIRWQLRDSAPFVAPTTRLGGRNGADIQPGCY